MSTMAEGTVLLVVGLMVVIVTILIIIVFIKLSVQVDEYRRKRAEQKKERLAVPAQEDRPGLPDEVAAVIALALHEYLFPRSAAAAMTAGPGTAPALWASSGRLETMASRQALINRRK